MKLTSYKTVLQTIKRPSPHPLISKLLLLHLPLKMYYPYLDEGILCPITFTETVPRQDIFEASVDMKYDQ